MLRSPLSSPLSRPLQSPLAARRGGGAPAFDPATLFGANDRGGVWDLSNSAGLFQLSNGTTAVTFGDPVGYIADLGPLGRHATQATAANRGVYSGMPRQLGSELAVNGRFTADVSWTKGTGWAISGGVATKTAGTASVLSQSFAFEAGKHYMVTFDVTRTAGTVLARFTGGTTVPGVSRNAAGSYTDVLIAATGNTTIEFSADATFAGTVKNVSYREVTQFVNAGARLDGVNDRWQTAAIDHSNSDKMTVIVAARYAHPTGGNATPFDVGSYYANTNGSVTALYASAPQGRLRGDTAQASSALPSTEGRGPVPVTHVNTFEFDIAGSTILEEIRVRARGTMPTNAASGTTSGGGNMVNGVVTIGSSNGGLFFWTDMIYRMLVINRILTTEERQQAEAWVKSGMVYCAVLGDSTVALNNAAVGLPNTTNVASLVGGLVCGASEVAASGSNIAAQKSAWQALTTKGALQAVIVQIGQNDVRSRIGGNTATTAQVIADLQDLIDTINADKPSGCRVYVAALTPSRAWLNGAANPAAAYAGWQALNEAISGAGSTPITGVDGRITSHVAALNDGSDNLLPIYDFNNDGVHENNEGRFIVAQAWRAQLEADGLV